LGGYFSIFVDLEFDFEERDEEDFSFNLILIFFACLFCLLVEEEVEEEDEEE